MTIGYWYYLSVCFLGTLADTEYHWEGDVPGQNDLINDYCRYVSWRSVHQACGHRDIKRNPTASKWENPEKAAKEEEAKKQKLEETKVRSKP